MIVIDRPMLDAPAVVARQRQWFALGLTRPPAARTAALRALRDAIVRHRSALLDSLYADLHKGPHEAASAEIGFTVAEIDFAIKHVRRWVKPVRQPAPLLAWPARAAVHAEPIGVTLIVGPWNYPVQLLLVPLVGALAAGCCAVLKPSELTPRTSAAIAAMVADAFPPEHVAVVGGGREASEALLRERWDTIFFTGSTAVGRAVMEAAAKHLTPVTLELGGKCPAVVCGDADVELAGRRIAWGKMLNAGQTCVAPDHVLVHRRVHDQLVDAIKRSLNRFFGPDPRESRHFGRIVNRRHFERLAAYLADGTVVHGGQSDAEDLYLAPTVLTGVAADSPVMGEEIFGPVLPVLAFDDFAATLETIRSGPSPLAAYVFGRDAARTGRFVEAARTGGVCVNDVAVHMFGRHLPFGGVGESGTGRYHGKASFDAFSNAKTVLRSGGRIDLPWRYPPVKMSVERFERLIGVVLRR